MRESQFINAVVITAFLVPYGCCREALQKTSRSCRYDTECVENAYCKDQSYCQCKNNFVYWEATRSCLPVATGLGDTCQVDLQCALVLGLHAECGQGTCKCRQGCHYKELERRCYETARIGEKCLVTSNCLLDSGLPATCYNSICTCPPGYGPTRDGHDCIQLIELGELCRLDQECTAQNSYCRDVCRCSVSYVESQKNKTTCLRAADEVGDPCEEDTQCTMYLEQAICSNLGKCSCLPDHHFVAHSSKCWRNIYLNELCDNSEECTVNTGKATCVNGRCHCAVGYTADKNNNCVAHGRNAGRRTSSCANIVVFVVTIQYVMQCFRPRFLFIAWGS